MPIFIFNILHILLRIQKSLSHFCVTTNLHENGHIQVGIGLLKIEDTEKPALEYMDWNKSLLLPLEPFQYQLVKTKNYVVEHLYLNKM